MPEAVAPFRQFVVKVASRCDLACDHCYVFEFADQSWRGRPAVMTDETAERVAARIAEHAAAHRLRTAHVILHGGEPLLAGPARLERIARTLRAALDGVAELDLRIHTNGVLLSERFCRVFEEHDIMVGISLDGDRAANDLHRLYRDGRSSYDKVIAAVDLLRERHPRLYAGLLCTIDVRNDPIAVYEALVALEPPRIDFLLPHATWDEPPLRPEGSATPYADWLIAIHDRWIADGRPVPVRLFDSITWGARGRGSQTESLGLSVSDLVVIETDGEYEQADSLKVAYDGAPATGLDVVRHSLDEVARHPGPAARRGGADDLADECRACPLLVACGGGLYAHRYRTGTGFRNPSVYCPDLFKLIPHVDRASGGATHTLPASALGALAAVTAGPGEIELLHAPQSSLTRLLVARAHGSDPGDSAWTALVRLDRDDRAAVRRAFGHPYVRAWAAGRAAGRGDARHLAAVAAAAAIAAGRPAKVPVPVTDGVIHLPGLGRLRVGPGVEAHVEVGDGGFAVHAHGHRYDPASPEWEPLRETFPGGPLVDDVDPYRDRFGRPARERLDETGFAAWREAFAAAWKALDAEHPDQAAVLRAGVRIVTPLTGDDAEVAVAREAPGALGVAGRPTPESLVRGFWRSRLAAVQDLFDLTGGDTRVEEELSAAYSRLAAAAVARPAEAADLLEEVRRGVRDLASGPLPDMGRRFVTGMDAAAAARLRSLPCAPPADHAP
ncbi:FxsB family cyclophane-forming radical SAM/SPASM peptide maturase [Bailinhaonella thermotolerans]|uniref:FxsB family radical SAM/SPASM domain protein n=1 Tax=Bailinhaonella thermotolerans TaxID=1070861 RepID=A0A3A4BDX8_9ACTN|nr:FxsB family cyclophane-forming radical SAM/SPASM peptide maturase [Bailinhaonella thermotolerans]RJL32500.1 FxsB family radical SAM/SPASM domain protein [Bailinhaonella thermotolerans]